MREKRLTLVRIIKNERSYTRELEVMGRLKTEPHEGEKLCYISNGEEKDTGEVIQMVIKDYKHPKYPYPRRLKIITQSNEYIADDFSKF